MLFLIFFSSSNILRSKHFCVVSVLALNRSCRPATFSTPIMPGEGREISGGWGIATSRYQVTPPPFFFPSRQGWKKRKIWERKNKTKRAHNFVDNGGNIAVDPPPEVKQAIKPRATQNETAGSQAKQKHDKLVRSLLFVNQQKANLTRHCRR